MPFDRLRVLHLASQYFVFTLSERSESKCGLPPTQLELSYPRIAGVAITWDGY